MKTKSITELCLTCFEHPRVSWFHLECQYCHDKRVAGVVPWTPLYDRSEPAKPAKDGKACLLCNKRKHLDGSDLCQHCTDYEMERRAVRREEERAELLERNKWIPTPYALRLVKDEPPSETGSLYIGDLSLAQSTPDDAITCRSQSSMNGYQEKHNLR